LPPFVSSTEIVAPVLWPPSTVPMLTMPPLASAVASPPLPTLALPPTTKTMLPSPPLEEADAVPPSAEALTVVDVSTLASMLTLASPPLGQ